MTKHLLIGLLASAALIGCAPRPEVHQPEPLPTNSFSKQWQANLALRHDSVKSIHLVGSSVIVYTQNNMGYWLGADGGNLKAINKLAMKDNGVFPPVQIDGSVLVPSTIALSTYSLDGKPQLHAETSSSAITSPAEASGSSIYVGTSPGQDLLQGMRLAKYDYSPKTGLALDWEVFFETQVSSQPAVFGNAVFAASLNGDVICVGPDRSALWPSDSFHTFAPITADLSADEYGLYIPSQDKKLYCLDRATGKQKWIYYAGMPLFEKANVIGNTVYQIVPRRGLAAINKTVGNVSRPAMWTQPLATQLLAVDDQFVYVRDQQNKIVALDKSTGEAKFTNRRSDLNCFATNTHSGIIYAATRDGTVLCIKPVLRLGNVGELVMDFSEMKIAG